MVSLVEIGETRLRRNRRSHQSLEIVASRDMEAASERRKAMSGSRLRLLLQARHAWRPIPILEPLIDRFAESGASGPITLRMFKDELYEVNRRIHDSLGRLTLGGEAGESFKNDLAYVLPLLKSRNTSWADISAAGRHLATDDEGSHHGYFVSLGKLMWLGRRINSEVGRLREPSVPCFCGLCWRIVVTSGKYCAVHAPTSRGEPRRKLKAGPSVHSAIRHESYWASRKLKPAFEAHYRWITSRSRAKGLRSSWRAAVNGQMIAEWLEEHRPKVHALVKTSIRKYRHQDIIAVIVRALDRVSGESGQERNRRDQIEKIFCQDLGAVFELILRAEAWLDASDERRCNWGGSRQGAGRPWSA